MANDRADRQPTGRSVGRLPKLLLEKQAVEQAIGELQSAVADYELAGTLAEGCLRTTRVEEARRRVDLATRLLAELRR